MGKGRIISVPFVAPTSLAGWLSLDGLSQKTYYLQKYIIATYFRNAAAFQIYTNFKILKL